MRLKSQLLVFVVAMAALGVSGSIVVAQTMGATIEAQSLSLSRAGAVLAGAERLEARAAEESVHLLGYLQGVSTPAQLKAARDDFQSDVLDLLSVAGADEDLRDRLLGVRAVEGHLFALDDGRPLFELLETRSLAREEALRLNALSRLVLAEMRMRSPLDDDVQRDLLLIGNDVERERVTLLEFEPGLRQGTSDGALRAWAKRLNQEIFDGALAVVAASSASVARALEEIARERPEFAYDAWQVRHDLAVAAARLEAVRPTDDPAATRALAADLERALQAAEQVGVTVARADLRGVGSQLSTPGALALLLAAEQGAHVQANLYFDATVLLHEVARGSLAERSASLRAAAAELIAWAHANNAQATAAALREGERAAWAGALIVAASFGGILVGAALLARRLLERIGSFGAAVRTVARGDLAGAPPSPRGDEFDDLAAAFSRMTQALAERDLEIARSNAVLAQSERMATLGSLVAGVAHEINNPLTFVRGNEELSLLDVNAALAEPSVAGNEALRTSLEAVRDGLERSLDGVGRIEQINRTLKTFARPAAGKHERFPVNDTIEGVLLMAHSRLHLHTVLRDYERVPDVEGSPQEFGQIVLNLVLNAVEATPQGATLCIRTRAQEGHVTVTVSDDGPGVPPHLADQIFGAFVTGKPTGTGLGLHISRKLAESRGGSLVLEPAPRGASFALRLPARPVAASEATSDRGSTGESTLPGGASASSGSRAPA